MSWARLLLTKRGRGWRDGTVFLLLRLAGAVGGGGVVEHWGAGDGGAGVGLLWVKEMAVEGERLFRGARHGDVMCEMSTNGC